VYGPEIKVTVDLPGSYQLSEAYPNPFNPQTSFTLSVAREQQVQVEVFNTLGQRVATLHDGMLASNDTRPFTFDATALPSGVYYIRVTGETFSAMRQVLLAK